jgi:hypothetical protein
MVQQSELCRESFDREQKVERIQDNEYKPMASAILVKFYDYIDSIMRVAGILRVPTLLKKQT